MSLAWSGGARRAWGSRSSSRTLRALRAGWPSRPDSAFGASRPFDCVLGPCAGRRVAYGRAGLDERLGFRTGRTWPHEASGANGENRHSTQGEPDRKTSKEP